MKHGRLHTGPPLALQPLQAEMARKKSSPRQNNSWQREKVTSWLSRLVTLRTPYKGQCPGLFANHMIFVIYPDQNGPSRTAHPFISFVWISLLSKHFLDLTKRNFLNPGQPTLTICSVLKKKSQNENEMLNFFIIWRGKSNFFCTGRGMSYIRLFHQHLGDHVDDPLPLLAVPHVLFHESVCQFIGASADIAAHSGMEEIPKCDRSWRLTTDCIMLSRGPKD